MASMAVNQINTTCEKLNNIDMMLRSTIESTSTSLSSMNASLHTTQDQLEEHFSEAQRNISSIAMDVANLNNSRVNFSQSCHKESVSDAEYDYSLDCRTGSLSIDRTVRALSNKHSYKYYWPIDSF